MDRAIQDALSDHLLALADDELILAHRNSEWTGHAPILEEDIAFANIAQDELGHATIWYELRKGLTGDDPDRLVFFRDADAYRCAQMVELPKGDWAFTMIRQYLFDAAEQVRLNALLGSAYRPLTEAAARIRPEEIYHYRHTTSWLRRLAGGTVESRRRTQQALQLLWPYALQLFTPLPHESELVTAGFVPDSAELQTEWEEVVRPFLAAIDLTVPVEEQRPATDRHHHTPHLTELLADLQEVARLDPAAEW